MADSLFQHWRALGMHWRVIIIIYQSIGRGQAGRQAGALLFISIHFKQHSFPSCLRPVEHRYVSSDIYVLHMDALTIVSKQNNSGLAVARIFENFLSYLIFATSE